MIQISRSLARQFRALLRKSIPAGTPRGLARCLILRAGSDGLRLQSQHPDAALELRVTEQSLPEETIALPAEALDDFEGRTSSPVTLELHDDSVVARWLDRVVPQSRKYAVPERMEVCSFPAEPADMVSQPAGFWAALRSAAETTKRDAFRYAVNCLQLRGAAGTLIATDGRQLLLQQGFAFPWEEDILVPALPILGCRELTDQEVLLGKSEDFVALRVGSWTVHLAITKEGRYPPAESIIPDVKKALATVELAGEDADFLVQTLDRLPGHADEYAPITIECNGRLTLRAKGGQETQPTDLVLTRSTLTGRSCLLAVNRNYLKRALQLGFRRLHLYGPHETVVGRKDNSVYAWALLSKESCLKASKEATRIYSAEPALSQTPDPDSPVERSATTMPETKNGQHRNGQADADAEPTPPPVGTGIQVLIDEAESLKEVLRDATGRVNQLVMALRRQRRQAQIVQSTLQSLRQLQTVSG